MKRKEKLEKVQGKEGERRGRGGGRKRKEGEGRGRMVKEGKEGGRRERKGKERDCFLPSLTVKRILEQSSKET